MEVEAKIVYEGVIHYRQVIQKVSDGGSKKPKVQTQTFGLKHYNYVLTAAQIAWDELVKENPKRLLEFVKLEVTENQLRGTEIDWQP